MFLKHYRVGLQQLFLLKLEHKFHNNGLCNAAVLKLAFFKFSWGHKDLLFVMSSQDYEFAGQSSPNFRKQWNLHGLVIPVSCICMHLNEGQWNKKIQRDPIVTG